MGPALQLLSVLPVGSRGWTSALLEWRRVPLAAGGGPTHPDLECGPLPGNPLAPVLSP